MQYLQLWLLGKKKKKKITNELQTTCGTMSDSSSQNST